MAYIQVSMYSNALQMHTNINVLMPTDTRGDEKMRVLYLLHGLGDDHTKWVRATRVEDYSWQYGVCIVMPEVQRSYYSSTVNGSDYDKYICEELPAFIERTFNVSNRSEDRYIAGLSMGGYGALKFGMREIGKYAGCAGLSAHCIPFGSGCNEQIAFGVFGNGDRTDPRRDLWACAKALTQVDASKRIKIYMVVGTEDWLIEQNRNLHKHLESLGIDHAYVEDSGSHNWDFWDKHIVDVLKFFFA